MYDFDTKENIIPAVDFERLIDIVIANSKDKTFKGVYKEAEDFLFMLSNEFRDAVSAHSDDLVIEVNKGRMYELAGTYERYGMEHGNPSVFYMGRQQCISYILSDDDENKGTCYDGYFFNITLGNWSTF